MHAETDLPRRHREVLFRAAYAEVREPPRPAVPPGFDTTLYLDVMTEAGQFRVELPCDAIARRLVDELARRTPGNPRTSRLPPGTQRACD
jgi:hypothetical protein